MTWSKLFLQLLWRSLKSPKTGLALVVLGWRFRREGWQNTPPFLPLPDLTNLRWRMYTIFGDTDTVPPADMLVQFANWAVWE